MPTASAAVTPTRKPVRPSALPSRAVRPRLELITARWRRLRDRRASHIASEPEHDRAGIAQATSSSSSSRQRATATATGRVASERSPSSAARIALPRPCGRPLLLDIGTANCCRWNRAADDAGDHDQREHVGQGRKSTAADSEYTGQRCESALARPNRSANAAALNGRHLPQITMARAMKPRPAVMFWLKELTKPMER